MKHITHRTVIQNRDLTQIRLHGPQIFNIRPIPIRAMLSIISCGEKLPLLLQPVDHRVGVFLHRGRKNHELEPLTHFAEEVITVRAFVNIIQDWVLGAEGLVSYADGSVQLDFDHVARRHAAAFGERVDEGFIEVKN